MIFAIRLDEACQLGRSTPSIPAYRPAAVPRITMCASNIKK